MALLVPPFFDSSAVSVDLAWWFAAVVLGYWLDRVGAISHRVDSGQSEHHYGVLTFPGDFPAVLEKFYLAYNH